jgi:choline dehydrogenase-like flavoprotein
VTGAFAANTFGKKLRTQLGNTLPRQVRIGYDIEQLPSPKNRVTISPRYTDAIGCYRPIIDYHVQDYTWQSMVESWKVSKVVFDGLGIAPGDQHFEVTEGGLPDEKKYRAPDGKDYLLNFIGAGHHMGTHRMSATRSDGVVTPQQQSWDHENLYVVGCGSFRTTGTANPTLTALAITLRSTKHMLKQLS